MIPSRHSGERTKSERVRATVCALEDWGRSSFLRVSQRPDILKRAQETCCPKEKEEELGVDRTESGNIEAGRERTPPPVSPLLEGSHTGLHEQQPSVESVDSFVIPPSFSRCGF